MDSPNSTTPFFDLVSRKWVERFEKAIVTDTGITLTDFIGIERFQEDLNDFFRFPYEFHNSFFTSKFSAGGTLIFGPRGGRKTFLAKALATHCRTTFIWTHASDFLATTFGLTEKSVSSLFKVARQRRPCVIFIDDIDLLCKDPIAIESESIRRVKAQFLRQIQREENRGTYLLATTNQPEKLDEILRQRFSKEIFISMPNVDDRTKMFQNQFSPEIFHQIDESEWKFLAEKTENFSSAKIVAVSREALMQPVRRLVSASHFKLILNPRSNEPERVWICCSADDENAVEMTLEEIPAEQICETPVTIDDFLDVLKTSL